MLTLFFGEQATETGSILLSGGLEGDERNPYTEIGKQLHNLIGSSQHVPQSFYMVKSCMFNYFGNSTKLKDMG
jgi:hypothetical protein